MLRYIPAPFLGKKRNKFISLLNKKVGKEDWFWAYKFKDQLYSWNLGLQIYEDAYWLFLKNNINLLKDLIKNYSDVFVFDATDLKSGLNYKKQDGWADHYEDIAIRRSLRRFGVWFKGEDLLKIPDSPYSENKVSFHLPYLFKEGKIKTLNLFQEYLVAVVAIDVADKYELSKILIR